MKGVKIKSKVHLNFLRNLKNLKKLDINGHQIHNLKLKDLDKYKLYDLEYLDIRYIG